MLYEFLLPFADIFSPFGVFRYISFRAGGAILTAFLIGLIVAPFLINWLRNSSQQPIRNDGPETHFTKRGTPTMGGLMILLSVTVSSLLWVRLDNVLVWVILMVFLAFGGIGFVDDWLKVTHQTSSGLNARIKLAIQATVAIVAAVLISANSEPHLVGMLSIPFFKDILLDLGLFWFVFAACVVVGTANAVNLTDGLDGLATVPTMMVAASLGIIVYLVGHVRFADYLVLQHVPHSGELAVFCSALVGGCLGFLWFNAPPAQVFMGDTGSLSLGGALGALAVAARHEIVLAILGGLFVLETLSVIVQVVSFKFTGKRVFAMAPLHHHFEKKGWAETTIVVRFWIVAFILALIGLSTLKLR